MIMELGFSSKNHFFCSISSLLLLKKSRSMIDSGIEAGDLDDQFIQMDMNDDERMKLDLKKKVNISFKS